MALQESFIVSCVALIHVSGKALHSWIASQWTTEKQKPSGKKKAKLQNILSEEELYGEQEPPLKASIKLVYLQTEVKPLHCPLVGID